MAENLNLQAPWVLYARKLKALFDKDPDIKVEYNHEDTEVKLYVEDADKANALSKILPECVEFGNIILLITVIPANVSDDYATLFQKAFQGNPAVAEIKENETVMEDKATYVLFEPEVVQFFSDDIGDYHGISSTLYQEIAKEIFEDIPVHFCTGLNPALSHPLGEWP